MVEFKRFRAAADQGTGHCSIQNTFKVFPLHPCPSCQAEAAEEERKMKKMADEIENLGRK